MRLATVLLAAVVLLAAAAGPVAAAKDPRFEVTVPEPDLVAGVTQNVTLELVNDARDVDDDVKTARNVRVRVLDAGPLDVHSGPRHLGTMPDGHRTSTSVRVEVPADAPGGTYDLPVRVTYEYDTDERETRTVTARVRVPDRPIFAVEAVESDLFQTETGTATVSLSNVGSLPANETTVTVAAETPALTVDGATETTAFVGDWAVGETRTVTVPVTATGSARAESYALSVRPTYLDEDAERTTAPAIRVGVAPTAGSRFSVADVGVTYFESRATVTATVTNRGPDPVRDVRVDLRADGPPVTVTDPTDAVGTLDPGASATVRFDVAVPPDAAPGPRPFSAVVWYRRGDARTYESGPIPLAASLPTDADVFSVAPVNATFGVDDSNAFTVRLTNRGPTALSDVRATLSLPPGLSSQSPSAYVAELAPGESATVTFEVTTPEDAVPTTDAIGVAVAATTPAGQSVTGGPYLVPYTVERTGFALGDTGSLAVGALAVVLLLVAGWVYLDRR